jgi:kynurenine 3-monooxygenase
LRRDCTTPSFYIRRAIDHALATVMAPRSTASAAAQVDAVSAYAAAQPKGWLPLYEMVTFSPWLRYSSARERAAKQARVVHAVELALGAGALSAVTWASWAAATSLISVSSA